MRGNEIRAAGQLLLVLCVISHASVKAQISVDEAKQRLQERQRQRATQPVTATTRPVRIVRPRAKIIKTLALKNGAPEPVRRWFASLPAYKDQQIDQLQAELIRRQNTPVRTYTTGSGTGGFEQVADEAEGRKKVEDVQRIRAQIQQLKNDQTFIYIPELPSFEVGNYGRVAGFKVVQVIDDRQILASAGGETLVWLKGFNAKNLADDAIITTKSPVVCTGTTSYTSVLGAKKTVMVVEPLDIDSWVETVDEEVPAK